MASLGEATDITIGTERAIEVATQDARVLFGIGPACDAPNRRLRGSNLLAALRPAVQSLRWCRQVHGNDILSTNGRSPTDAACIGTCDGLVTDQSGVGLMVWTADCVPVLLVGRHQIAAVHAGWRGTARGIVPIVVHRFRHVHGERPENLTAFLGPAISADNYQVGPEVISALREQKVAEAAWLDGDKVDLRGLLAAQLRQLGVEGTRTVGGCTASDPRMASFRRDGAKAGRQWSLVYRHQ
jgi:YfiH family protein